MWCGRRRVTRLAGSRLQAYRMETCNTEEPDEGNLHVRICGGLGRAIAESTWTTERRIESVLESTLLGRRRLNRIVRAVMSQYVRGHVAAAA